MWHDLFDLFYLMSEQGRVVAAAHQLQHIVASALQRDVEMRCETFAVCHEIDRLVRDQVRFDGGDAVTYDPFHLVERPDQVDERLPGALSEIADVDTCQHDFFSPLGCHFFGLFHHAGDRPVAAAPTGKGNRTVGTEIIASVLHFQKMARTVVCRTRGGEGTDVFRLGRDYGTSFFFLFQVV